MSFISVSPEYIIVDVLTEGRREGWKRGGRKERGGRRGGKEGGSWEDVGGWKATILQHDGFIPRKSLTVQNSSFYDCDNTNTFISLLKLTF